MEAESRAAAPATLTEKWELKNDDDDLSTLKIKLGILIMPMVKSNAKHLLVLPRTTALLDPLNTCGLMQSENKIKSRVLTFGILFNRIHEETRIYN